MKKRMLTLAMAIFFCFFTTLSWAADGDPLLEPLTIDKVEGTDLSGSDGVLITGTEGTNGNLSMWNADGDLVDAGVAATSIIPAATFTADGDFLVGTGAGTYAAESGATVRASLGLGAAAVLGVTGSDLNVCTGTAGTSGNIAIWNADGDLVDGGAVAPGSFGSETAATISGGVVDASAGANFLGLAGEGAAADDLTEIQAAAVGDIVVLSNPNAASYTVTVKDGTYLQLQADFSLDNVADTITVICTNAGANDTFREISRANNG